jgi:carbonic anhydrase
MSGVGGRNASTAIRNLMKGFRTFRREHIEQVEAGKAPTKDGKATFAHLVKNGQSPTILTIACSDSRVDPSIITGSEPGDMFVVRNVANLVPPYELDNRRHGTSAALEYGVTGLGVSDIIVFGHSDCGGIRALMELPEVLHDRNIEEHVKTPKTGIPNDFVGNWMSIARPAKLRVLTRYFDSTADERRHHAEKESLLVSLDNLQTFPWIRERVASKTLQLHAWYFNMRSGMIESYEPQSNEFVPLIEMPAWYGEGEEVVQGKSKL